MIPPFAHINAEVSQVPWPRIDTSGSAGDTFVRSGVQVSLAEYGFAWAPPLKMSAAERETIAVLATMKRFRVEFMTSSLC